MTNNQGTGWDTGWAYEGLVAISNSMTIRIPYINSGKDKIFYIVEHNNIWGPGAIGLFIGESYIGNFYTSFSNPFATHYNSKYGNRYFAVKIPKEKLPQKSSNPTSESSNSLYPYHDFLTVVLRFPTNSGQGIYISGIGTHDADS